MRNWRRLDPWVRAHPWTWSACVGVGMLAFIAVLQFGFGLGLGGGTGERLFACALWGVGFFVLNAAQYCPTPRWMRRRHS